MAPQPQSGGIGLTEEQNQEMYRQVEAGYLASQGQFNDQLQRDVRQQQFQVSLQRDIERSLSNNPEFSANLPVPRADFNVPAPRVTSDPYLASARVQIGDVWNEGIRQLSYSGVDRQFAESFDRLSAAPRSTSDYQVGMYGPEIDNSLYFAPGFFKSAYDIAAAGFDDPNATLLNKAVYLAGAAATALPMMAEEAGRFILNAPHSASVGGQLVARGNLATDTGTKVESYLAAVSSFANAFNGFAALTPPSLMLPNMNAVPAVTMSAEQLAAVRATYARVDADTIYTFRGDTLAPAVVFNRGFAARGSSADLYLHAVDNANPPSAYVPTSQSFDVAADFATGFGTRSGNVYVVRPTNGIDVNRALGSRSPYPTEFEVAVPVRIAPSDIRAVTPLNTDGSLTGVSILNPAFRR